MPNPNQHHEDPWFHLRSFTKARIALGRAGNSIPTEHLLQFKLDHARAKDAVYAELNIKNIVQFLNELNYSPILLKSQAQNRSIYLKRPDLGRKLEKESELLLLDRYKDYESSINNFNGKISLVIVDGLSAEAINQYTIPIVKLLHDYIQKDNDLEIINIAIVQQGRVAIGDHIGQILNADFNITLIGERPGLLSSNSMGCYMCYQPNSSYTDDNRNCISNIHTSGLSVLEASNKILFMLKQMSKKKTSGVLLKDRSSDLIDY